jgi:hypothetical protein
MVIPAQVLAKERLEVKRPQAVPDSLDIELHSALFSPSCGG